MIKISDSSQQNFSNNVAKPPLSSKTNSGKVAIFQLSASNGASISVQTRSKLKPIHVLPIARVDTSDKHQIET